LLDDSHGVELLTLLKQNLENIEAIELRGCFEKDTQIKLIKILEQKKNNTFAYLPHLKDLRFGINWIYGSERERLRKIALERNLIIKDNASNF
jgi:hypothetical protein